MNQSIAILPSNLSLFSSSSSSNIASSSSSRFLKLPHPRTGLPCLFLPASSISNEAASTSDLLLEVQAVNATGDRKRSWFVNDDTVIGDGKLLLFTPFDPLFLLIRILQIVESQNISGSSQTRSLPYQDIFETAGPLMAFPTFAETDHSRSNKRMKLVDEEANTQDDAASQAALEMLCNDLLAFSNLYCVQQSMRDICHVQNITEDLSTYKLDNSKVFALLKAKVDKLATKEAFELSPTLARLLAKEGVGDGQGISAQVQLEARQKASLDLLAAYLTKEIASQLRATYTFPHLEQYLLDTSSTSVLSVDYMPGLSTPSLSVSSSSSSSLSTESTFGMSKKGSSGNLSASGAGGKKKPTKGMESNGVKQLKKASTRGMTPLTSFFKKTPSPNIQSPSPGV